MVRDHEGDWDLARRMITAAAGAGATIVKVQSYRAADVADDDPEKSWYADEFRTMAAMIETAATLRGSAQKAPTPAERPLVERVRSRFPKHG